MGNHEGEIPDGVANHLNIKEEGLIRDGVMHRIVGGMQQIHLKKGDIIVNHKQMEELEKGEAKSGGGRGRLIGAFAHGTLDGMHAFNDYGKGSYKPASKTNYSNDNKTKSKTTKSQEKAIEDNTDKTKKNTKAKTEEKTAAEKLKDAFDNLHDWIERWIERENQIMDLWESKADNEVKKFTTRNKYLNTALKRAQKDSETVKQSAKAYKKQANKVAKKGLSNSLVKKIQDGNPITIQDLKHYKDKNGKKQTRSDKKVEELKELIDEYQTWYDKYLSAKEQQVEWEKKVYELEQQRLDNIQNHYDTLVGLHDSVRGLAESRNNVRLARGNSRAEDSKYVEDLRAQRTAQNKETNVLSKEMDKYKAELKKAAKIYGKSSDQYKKAETEYNNISSAYFESIAASYELRDAIFENTRALKEMAVKKWSRVLDRLSAAGDYYSARYDSVSTKNKNATTVAINTSKRSQSEIAALWDSVNTKRSQLKNYAATSEQYQSLADEINSDLVSIMNLGADVYKQMDAIFEIYVNSFDDSVEKLTTAVEESRHLIDLMGEDTFVDKSGNLTDNGQAGLLLYATMIDENSNAIEDWRQAIADVNSLRAKGLISEERQNELVSQYTKNIQDAVAANKDYAKSLTEIYKKQLENENNLLQENINKRKEALQKKEDYYNYDRTLRDQNKDIQSLTAQIKALENTSSAAGQARRLQLQEQLRQAQESKDDTVREHRNQLLEEGYDSLSANSQKALDDTLTALETNATFQQQIVSQMLDNIVNNYDTAYSTITDIIAGSGDVISSTLNSAPSSTASSVKNVIDLINDAKKSLDNSDGSGTGGDSNNNIKTSGGENVEKKLNEAKETTTIPKNVSDDSNNTNNQGTGGTQIDHKASSSTGGNNDKKGNTPKAYASSTSVTVNVNKTKSITVYNGPVTKVTGDKHVTVSTIGALMSGVSNPSVQVTFTGKSAGKDTISIVTKNGTVKVTVTVKAASGTTAKSTTSYFKKYTGKSTSIVDGLAAIGAKSTYDYRKKIAAANNIKNYSGTAAQNTKMLNLLKKGKLIKPKKKGGMIDQIIPIKGILGGDDGLASVQIGEAVLSRPFMQDVVPEFMNTVKQTTKLLQPIGGNGGEVNVHYDSLLTVNGNVDKDALPGLRDLLQQSYEYTSQKMYKDLSKLGFK